ncbi:hypothetical protein K491DRAFT_682318 [Lophiostoma macrostomum CBS 122681]|uniref:DUF567-domain-containing protein n=1 Tax=Lophiostoma macrostomum CBS 122681 TaxID=1314788 RepID=A0A6A6STX3_9PLEO|nr:hypothetical protein K491DRAFT_682318 [Lophiostoma macrostomum CBS 122681]
MAHLAPVLPPVGYFTQFTQPEPETIVLKEKVLSITGDSFSIKTVGGIPLFQVEGKVMSLSGRKKVRDMQGNHLFDICKEHFHIHTTFAIKGPDDKKIMQVKSKFKLFGSEAIATFTSTTTGQDEVLTMKGNFFDTTANITDEAKNGIVVARIDRKLLSGKDIIFGQQTYAVQIAPNVDKALIAAMCICLDEKKNEGS